MTLEEENKILRAENTELRRTVASLTQKVEDLLKMVEELGHKKNSKNSSLPPSSDFGRKNKSLRGRSGKKSGGQVGHRGSTLFQQSQPDVVTDLKSSSCPHCGGSLSSADFELTARRQVVDLPPVTPICHEYRQYSCICPHCHNKEAAPFPKDVSAPIQYGAHIQALISYLSVYQYIPYRRLAEMCSQVFGIHLSEGSIQNILLKASSKAEVIYDAIKEKLSQSSVVGSDETGAKVNGEKWWIWTWQDALNTYIVPSETRGYKAIELEWKDGLPGSALVSDRLSAQLKTPARVHQVCLAHLLRDLMYLEEVEKHPFAIQFKGFIKDIFEFSKEQKEDYSVDSEKTIPFEEKLNALIAMPIDQEHFPKTTTFQRSMIKVRNYILPCIYERNIPPDNNASERAIRNVKVKQKVSGQFKTGQKAFCILRSVIDTIKKRKHNIMLTLQDIMQLEPKGKLLIE